MIVTLTKEEAADVLLEYIQARVRTFGRDNTPFGIKFDEYSSDEFVKFTEIKEEHKGVI